MTFRNLMAIGLLALAGCASFNAHMPWGHKVAPPPEVSTALTVVTPEGTPAPWPQFWKRNDVVLDLSALSGSGTATVAPRSGLAWPVRVALRVTPGSIGSLDVHGAQRFVVPVPASGKPLDIELPPGIYQGSTRQLTVNWGPASVPP